MKQDCWKAMVTGLQYASLGAQESNEEEDNIMMFNKKILWNLCTCCYLCCHSNGTYTVYQLNYQNKSILYLPFSFILRFMTWVFFGSSALIFFNLVILGSKIVQIYNKSWFSKWILYLSHMWLVLIIGGKQTAKCFYHRGVEGF